MPGCVSQEEAWAVFLNSINFFSSCSWCYLASRAEGQRHLAPRHWQVPSFCLKTGTDCIAFLNYSPGQPAPSHIESLLPLGFTPACSSAAVKPGYRPIGCLLWFWQDPWHCQMASGFLPNAGAARFCCLQLSWGAPRGGFCSAAPAFAWAWPLCSPGTG